ncbi:TPA: hypothetical protein ACGOVK_001204 [Streptococcus suis]|uniref:hypothetical protein n=1 Tax=Streptococcus sp. VTCC 12905 TaxID=3413768 RepID=UPI002117E94A|nr:hypothetical protein [Streptococcus suis]
MYHSLLSLNEKLLLLNQLYTQQLVALIQVQNKSYVGTISQLSPKQIMVKTQEGYITILLQDITDIRLEDTDESIRISEK